MNRFGWGWDGEGAGKAGLRNEEEWREKRNVELQGWGWGLGWGLGVKEQPLHSSSVWSFPPFFISSEINFESPFHFVIPQSHDRLNGPSWIMHSTHNSSKFNQAFLFCWCIKSDQSLEFKTPRLKSSQALNKVWENVLDVQTKVLKLFLKHRQHTVTLYHRFWESRTPTEGLCTFWTKHWFVDRTNQTWNKCEANSSKNQESLLH